MVKAAIAVFWVFGFPTLWSRTSMVKLVAVSYTHLTLPTIYSV